jgi:hypothetical protein
MTLGAHLFGLPNVSQAGLELASGNLGALLFSQCNVAWRSFLQPRGSGCQSFDSSWCFVSMKCDSSISARFLIITEFISLILSVGCSVGILPWYFTHKYIVLKSV